VSSPRAIVAVLGFVAAMTVAIAHHAGAQRPRVIGKGELKITPQIRAAGFTFSPTVAPADRQLIAHEVALARPEAQRLIDDVDGLVTITVGDASSGRADAVGLTQASGDGFVVTLNLGAVYSTGGERGVQRLVLHELGHVVDAALLKPELAARLDAPIPRGYGCDPQQPDVGCAPREERFAETFAKWATGDIGVNLPLGYKVEPPPSLDDWGAQLVSGVGAAA
jgi:hypothetical protein